MFYSLQSLLLLFILNHYENFTFASQTFSGGQLNSSKLAVSNLSSASNLTQIHSSSSASASESRAGNYSHSTTSATTALPTPFSQDPDYEDHYLDEENYQDIQSGTCAISDSYCWFRNNNGSLEKANATSLADQCLLWNPSCSGNRTLAMKNFFNTTFHESLLQNACFGQVKPQTSTSVSKCDTYNPPERMSELQGMRDWMRSQQCVSDAMAWADTTSVANEGNFTVADAKENKGGSEDPDSQIEAQYEDPYPTRNNSASLGVAGSCCGVCYINAETVDIYYWPESEANTSCLSIVGESVLPLGYGATTTVEMLNSTTTYWGCNPRTFTDYNPRVNSTATFTYISATTTAQITTIGDLTVKMPVVDPWASSPCTESGVGSQESNGSIEVRDQHAPMHARGHTLMTPSVVTRNNFSSPVTTTVSGNFTL